MILASHPRLIFFPLHYQLRCCSSFSVIFPLGLIAFTAISKFISDVCVGGGEGPCKSFQVWHTLEFAAAPLDVQVPALWRGDLKLGLPSPDASTSDVSMDSVTGLSQSLLLKLFQFEQITFSGAGT